jgi:hypothetical protein
MQVPKAQKSQRSQRRWTSTYAEHSSWFALCHQTSVVTDTKQPGLRRKVVLQGVASDLTDVDRLQRVFNPAGDWKGKRFADLHEFF